MEVSEHGVDSAEGETGLDEETGFAGEAEHGAFDSADGGGADAEDVLGGSDAGFGFGGDMEAFGVEFSAFRGQAHGLEGPESDVEGDAVDLGAALAAGAEDFGGEVEAGGGCGDGARVLGEDGLVALAVRLGVGALDVGRQGDMADFVEEGEQIGGVEDQGALAEFALSGDGGGEVGGELDLGAGADLASWFDEGLPGLGTGGGVEEEDFDRGCGGGEVAVEPGREDAGVVQDQVVLGGEVGGEVFETVVAPSLGVAVEHEHARIGAAGEGLLGDGGFGEVEVEFGGVEHWYQLLSEHEPAFDFRD